MLISELQSKKLRTQGTELIYRVTPPKTQGRVIPFSKARFTIYGAFLGNTLAGVTVVDRLPALISGDLTLKELSSKVDIFIYGTYVLPEFRNKGVASALRSQLQSKYTSIITGTCSRSDPAIHHLNGKQGFKGKVTYPNGNAIWLWQK